ncbi:MAG: hypothetical protein WAW96_02270, partial [Alphaproteobacteria bacterium]
LDQASNILWTGLGSSAATAYVECLRANVLTAPGLHITVDHATDADVALTVTWNVPGASAVKGTWSSPTVGGTKLPVKFQQGSTAVVVPRPTNQKSMTLALNVPNYTAQIVLTSLAPPIAQPVPPCDLNDEKGNCLRCSGKLSITGKQQDDPSEIECTNMANGEAYSARVAGSVYVRGDPHTGSWMALKLVGPGSTSDNVSWLGDNVATNPIGFQLSTTSAVVKDASSVKAKFIFTHCQFGGNAGAACATDNATAWKICSTRADCTD